MAFNLAGCDYCGDCRSLCKYTGYDNEGAAGQITKGTPGKPAINACVVLPGLFEGRLFEGCTF